MTASHAGSSFASQNFRAYVWASWMTLRRKKVLILFFFLTSWQAVCLSETMFWGMSLFRNRSSFCLLDCPPLHTLQEFYPSLCNKAEKWAPCWETVGGPLSPKRTLWEAIWDVGLLWHNREWNITFFIGTGKHLFLMGKPGLLTAVFFPLCSWCLIYCKEWTTTAGWVHDSCSWKL